MSFQGKYAGKNVLVTGHTGFKGSWLISWLKKLGANVNGISIGIPTTPSHYSAANLKSIIVEKFIDIRNIDALTNAFLSFEPDFVFHLAAQPLVRVSYENPVDTFSTNIMGTINILESLRKLKKPCSAVIITSDKCYDNVEWEWGYRETDKLGGPDPYSASKGAAEIIIQSYVKSFFSSSDCLVKVASARAGNVIGGGDWAVDRIIPDCVKAWADNLSVVLRNPSSTRPWQHVLEPLSGYLLLALSLNSSQKLHGESFNFGPPAQQNQSVLQLVEEMSKYWKQVNWEINESKLNSRLESGLLKLNCDKALHFLHWHAAMGFNDTVKMTAEWYRDFYNHSKQISETTISQITLYEALAKEQGLKWAL